MLRREFLIGAAASVAAALPAYAGPPKPFGPDMWPPMGARSEFVAWMAANRGEEPTYLGRRYDRYKVLLSFNDLWTQADKRAFLMTPREEFVLPEDRENAYVGHYLDIGFGVTITPPGTMGRMTSALDIRGERQRSRDRHGLRLPVGVAHLSDEPGSFDRNHPRARDAHARRLRSADRRRLPRIRGDRDPERRRLLRLGGRGALRQDHRHLRHRPHSPAAPAAIEAERLMVIPIGPPGAQHILKVVKTVGAGRRSFGRPVGHFRRQGHPVRAALRRPSARRLRARELRRAGRRGSDLRGERGRGGRADRCGDHIGCSRACCVVALLSAWSALALWFRLPRAGLGERGRGGPVRDPRGGDRCCAVHAKALARACRLRARLRRAHRLVEHDQAAGRRRLGAGRRAADDGTARRRHSDALRRARIRMEERQRLHRAMEQALLRSLQAQDARSLPRLLGGAGDGPSSS